MHFVVSEPHPFCCFQNLSKTQCLYLLFQTSSWEGNGNPLQYSCLENFMDRGAWRATVRGVAKSQTQLSDSHIKATISCDNFTSFPCFWWSLQFWELVSYFVGSPSICICHILSSCLYWDYVFEGGGPQRENTIFITMCQGYTINITYQCWN